MSDTNLVEEPIAPLPVRGDLTRGPILRTLLLFSMPTLGTSLLQSLNMTVNSIWVGQLLGERALAATSNASTIAFLAFATVFGFSMATTVRVGQQFGLGDVDGVRRAFAGGSGFSTAVTVVCAVIGWFYIDELIDILSTPPAIRPDARIYLNIVFISLPFTTISMMVSTGLRGCGDARTPLIATIASSIVSVALNPVLILGLGPFPALGIGGSALTLVISSLISAITMLSLIYLKDLPMRLRGHELRYLLPSRDELSYVMSKGVPMGLQTVFATLASLIMVGLVNREGLLTAAAYGAVLQLWNYMQMPGLAVGTAVSAMVAQNIGAGRHDRVHRITMAGLGATGAVTTATFVGLLICDAPILALFLGNGSTAVPIAEHIELFATWAWIFGGMNMTINGTLRAYGIVVQPLFVMIIAYYFARLGFYFIGYPLIGVDALWLAFPFGAIVGVVLSWLTYTHGRWRRRMGLAKRPWATA